MIKLAKPYLPEECINNVIEVIQSGNLIQGKFVNLLEEKIKEYLNVKYAFLVSSGTAALHIGLIALGIKENDEVIVPAFTFPATANVVELLGAKSILVDIKIDDCCIDVSKIESAITNKTKAILPVHEFGQPADIKPIINLAKKYKLNVIEDAACALGSEYDFQKVGTFGDIGCFSLHPRKAITSGEGGIIVTNDDNLALEIKMLRNHGICIKDTYIDFMRAGFNYRLTDIQAALCLPQFNELDKIIQNRIKTAKKYDELLGNNSHFILPKNFENRKMVYQSYHIILNENINRDEIIKLLKDNQIETNYGAYALNNLSYYSNKYGYLPYDYPFATKAFKQGLVLPIGMHLKDENIEKIVSLLNKVIK